MRKKTRSHQQKVSLLRGGRRSLLAKIILCAFACGAQTSRLWAQDSASMVPCGEATGISIPVPQSFESIDLRYPSVLCAFRNKNSGFPTLNVVQDPPQGSSLRPGVAALEARVKNEYQKVGLTDAVISDSHMEPLGSLETFHTTARYMNQGMPMQSLIMVVMLPDRTYTVTLLDRADHPYFREIELQSVLRGISIAGATDAPATVPPPPNTTAIWLILGAMGLVAASLVWRRAHARKSR